MQPLCHQYMAVLEMLGNINFEFENKKIAIISNSDIFSKNLALLLEKEGADAKHLKPNHKDLKKISSDSDVLISAVGDPHFIKKDFIKKDAVIIDIGISKKNKKRREVKRKDEKGRREERKLTEDWEWREEKKRKKLKRNYDRERIDAQERNGGGSSKEGRE